MWRPSGKIAIASKWGSNPSYKNIVCANVVQAASPLTSLDIGTFEPGGSSRYPTGALVAGDSVIPSVTYWGGQYSEFSCQPGAFITGWDNDPNSNRTGFRCSYVLKNINLNNSALRTKVAPTKCMFQYVAGNDTEQLCLPGYGINGIRRQDKYVRYNCCQPTAIIQPIPPGGVGE